MPESRHPPLPSLTRELNALADANQAPAQLADALRNRAPQLAAQIESDGRHPEMLQLWGTSSRSDASQADTPTTHPALLAAIGLLARTTEMNDEVVHAGLMHTYGYLLSNVKTPFGFKRQRYTQVSIARGLGLRPHGALSPWPAEGTLLANLTRVAGTIALPGGALDSLRSDAASLSGFDPKELERLRVIECVCSIDGQPPADRLAFQTDVLTLKPHAGDEFTHLLVYSIVSGEKHRLITAFPVKAWALGKLHKAAKKAEGSSEAPIRLRYNARLREPQDGEFRGSVEIA